MAWLGTIAIQFFIGQLVGATYEMRDVDGEGVEEECISIPLRRNGIAKHHTKGAILSLTLTKLRRVEMNRTHFLSVYLNKDIQKEVNELGYAERLKFIGEGREMTDEFYSYILKKQRKYKKKL